METVTVMRWNERMDAHECSDEKGNRVWLDLVTDGSLPCDDMKSLEGKTVEFEYSHPYLSIAHGVKLVEGA